MKVEKKRIFVGGLFPSINESDLRDRFSHFGTVSDIEIKTKKGDLDTPTKTFAYLDITASEQNLKKCFSLLNKTKWKGQELKLEEAKESFLTRLQAERQEIKKQDSQDSQTSSPYSDNHVTGPLDSVPGIKDFVMKGATPGTPVPGEKNWIVGKYGRILPIVYVRKKDKKKIMKVDPSKFTHNLKRIKPEQNEEEEEADIINPDSLTWELDDSNDTEITRKRKGIFPEWKSKHKILKHLDMNTESHQNRKSDESAFEIVTKADLDMKDLLVNKSTKDVEEDSYSSADTDEIISVSKRTKGKLNKSSIIDFSGSLTTSTPNWNVQSDCLMDSTELKYNLTPNLSVTLNSQMQSKDKEKNGNVVSFSKRLTYWPENRVTSLSSNANESSTKVKDLKTMKPRVCKEIEDSENERKRPKMQEFKGTKSLYDRDNTTSFLSEKVKDKRDTHMLSGTTSNMSAINSSRLVPEFHISMQNSALREKDNIDSDQCSVKSDDTDEIIGLNKKARQVYSPLMDKSIPISQKNRRPSFILTGTVVVDEFSSGFVDVDAKQNVSENEDTYDEESDFETFAKKELTKFEKNRKSETSIRNKGNLVDEKIVKSRSKERGALSSSVKKTEKDKKVTHPQSTETGTLIVNDTTESTKVRAREGKKMKVEKNEIMELERKQKIVEKRQDKAKKKEDNNDRNLKQKSDDQKRLETVKKKQKEVEAQKTLIKKALSNIDQGSSGNKKIVFSSDSETETNDVDVKKLCKEASTLVSRKLKSLTSHSNNSSSLSDTDSTSDQSDAQKRKSFRLLPGDPSSESEDDSFSDNYKPEYSISDIHKKKLIRPQEEHDTSKSEAKSDNEGSESEISQSDSNHTEPEDTESGSESSVSCGLDSHAGFPSEEVSENTDNSDSDMARSGFEDIVETVAKGMKINHKKQEQKGRQKISLFDGSSDTESDEDEEASKRDQDMFRLRSEFEGEAGKKLMKLQSRYGNDPRFRLDNRFRDSDSDGETRQEKDEEDETTKSLKILQDVLGGKTKIKVTIEERTKNKFKDVTALHYDPTREDHQQYEIKKPEGTQKEMQQSLNKSEKKKKQMKQDSQHQDDDDEKKKEVMAPTVNKEKFYKVSSSLTEAFGHKSNSTQSDNKSFSLLAMFGNNKDKKEENRQDGTDDLDQEGTEKSLKIKTPFLWQHFGGGDDDSDGDSSDAADAENKNKEIKEESNKQGTIPVFSTPRKTFFFTEDDERLKEGATFYRMDDLELVREKWAEQRPQLVEVYKTKHKQQRRKSRDVKKRQRFGR